MSCNTSSKKKKSFPWISFYKKKEHSNNIEEIERESTQITFAVPQIAEERQEESLKKTILLNLFYKLFRNIADKFGVFVAQNRREFTIIIRLYNRCIAGVLLILMYCILGACFFQSFERNSFEGNLESYKSEVKRIEEDFLTNLWNNANNLSKSEWKNIASKKLMAFQEQLRIVREAGSQSYSDRKSWSFLNAFTYCATLITTFGYGHITPNTNMGKITTVVYIIFGIPMFITILSNFDKLFKHSIKFIWTFIKLYYTCYRKLDHTMPGQNSEEMEEMQRQQMQQQQTVIINLDANTSGMPDTLSSTFFNDQFNLPISIAIFIFLTYIFMGAILYHMMENWNFFDSFYFAFICISTTSFDNYVPKEPIYMMYSIVYLVFSQTFRTMFISIIQMMLSNLFKSVSQKIGTTMCFEVFEDEPEEISPADQNCEHRPRNF